MRLISNEELGIVAGGEGDDSEVQVVVVEGKRMNAFEQAEYDLENRPCRYNDAWDGYYSTPIKPSADSIESVDFTSLKALFTILLVDAIKTYENSDTNKLLSSKPGVTPSMPLP